MESSPPDIHVLENDDLIATISANGAELWSLRTRAGLELIWQAGPEWPRHAPILFPIVGRLSRDTLDVDGHSYSMTQHGFARDRTFGWTTRERDFCRLTLQDDAATRAIYPFAFQLDVAYRLEGRLLALAFDVTNPGDRTLPVSLGAHPAFNWPLDPSQAKSGYWLEFEQDETAPIRRLTDGLLKPDSYPTPIQNKRLDLSECLFVADAIILDPATSRSVRYLATNGPAIDISWHGFSELGLWSKPSGAPFLCIEPWRGFASPTDFNGAFADKPGLMHLAPGETRQLSLSIGMT